MIACVEIAICGGAAVVPSDEKTCPGSSAILDRGGSGACGA
jgi:hypothetical protein